MIIQNADQLGAVIRRTRKAKGLTQSDLADAAGVSRYWIITTEAGAPTARLDLILATLTALDLALDVVHDEPDDALDTVLRRARD